MTTEQEAMLASAPEAGGDDDIVIIDMSEAKEYAPLTGKFPLEVVEAKYVLTKTSGAPSIDLKLRIFEGDHTGRVFFRKLMLSGAGSGISKRYLDSLGANIDWTEAKPRIVVSRLVGLRAFGTLAPDQREQYKHKTEVTDMTAYVSSAGQAV
jgi:hypothetical protein